MEIKLVEVVCPYCNETIVATLSGTVFLKCTHLNETSLNYPSFREIQAVEFFSHKTAKGTIQVAELEIGEKARDD